MDYKTKLSYSTIDQHISFSVMTTLNEYDVVKLTRDLPELELKKGAKGTVLMVFTEPRLAYEVEFLDRKGRHLAELAVLPEYVTVTRKAWVKAMLHKLGARISSSKHERSDTPAGQAG
jgi:hypothetical protein